PDRMSKNNSHNDGSPWSQDQICSPNNPKKPRIHTRRLIASNTLPPSKGQTGARFNKFKKKPIYASGSSHIVPSTGNSTAIPRQIADPMAPAKGPAIATSASSLIFFALLHATAAPTKGIKSIPLNGKPLAFTAI